jgi:hypothetical protein
VREIATTLTDYLMAGASLAAALTFPRRPAVFPARGPVLFFTGFALAALFGGTWHGYFSGMETPEGRLLWWCSMLFAGASAAGLAVTGCELLGVRNRTALLAASGIFLLGFGVYIWDDMRFLPSLMATATGTLVCLAGLANRVRHRDGADAWMAMAALALSVVAALVQQVGLAIHPVHFDHNATYHVLLLPALGLFYAGLRRIEH